LNFKALNKLENATAMEEQIRGVTQSFLPLLPLPSVGMLRQNQLTLGKALVGPRRVGLIV
jgi:hypothetical protein